MQHAHAVCCDKAVSAAYDFWVKVWALVDSTSIGTLQVYSNSCVMVFMCFYVMTIMMLCVWVYVCMC